MASQAYAERIIIAECSQPSRGAVVAKDESAQCRPVKVEECDQDNAELLGLRVLQALAFRPDSRRVLTQGGVREKFGKTDKAYNELRYARELINASAAAWQSGVQDLAGRGILVKASDGTWMLGSSRKAKYALKAKGFKDDMFTPTH